MDESYYWLTHRPTIAEVRRLLRETPWLWPLAILSELIEAGIDLDLESDAVLRQVVIETEECVEARIEAWRNERLIAELGIGYNDHDGSWEYFALWRRLVI